MRKRYHYWPFVEAILLIVMFFVGTTSGIGQEAGMSPQPQSKQAERERKEAERKRKQAAKEEAKRQQEQAGVRCARLQRKQ